MADDIAAAYWEEALERNRLMHGTRDERIEYQTRLFPIEDAIATRIDDKDASLVDDLVRIAETAPDPEALGLFGAGVVWELLYHGGGDNAERIEKAARSSQPFLDAVRAGFAGWDGMPAPIEQRLRPLIDE